MAATPYGTLPPSDLLNLDANWNSVGGAPIDLSVFMTNVTNERVWLSITNGWNGFANQTVIPGEPRMFGARVRYRFGS